MSIRAKKGMVRNGDYALGLAYGLNVYMRLGELEFN